tara:strand:+ start:368 stop:601 length:234 start_codon:yes stop_codon:yes gene_type:complete
MSRFYGEVKGNRGKTSRCGSKASGIWGHIRGWNLGVFVDCRVVDGKDVIEVFKTDGSNGYSRKLLYTLEEDGSVIEP